MSENNNNKIRAFIRKIANKYLIVSLLFIVWVGFLDRNSIREKIQLRRKITTLEKEEQYYKQKIEEDNRKMQELMSNRENLEKFAREQYFMKNSNEDIYIISDK